MTDLSLAAQAVLDAFLGDCEHTGLQMDDLRENAAAALRAAAKELGPSRKLEPGYVFSAPAEHWHYEFKLEAERRLLAIAAELEGATIRSENDFDDT
jgi:hypothetical protein